MKNKATDSEGLVVQCCQLYSRFVAFTHYSQHGEGDKDGKDFFIQFRHSSIKFDLQVKTSDIGETLGLILPLPDPIPPEIERRLSAEMKRLIRSHERLHPHIRFLLFVARPDRDRSPQSLIREIWTEIMAFYYAVRDKEAGKLVSRQTTHAV